MPEPTKRMNYFDQQFLRAKDFQDEQEYHLLRRRLRNLMDSPGVVADGLIVTGDLGSTTVKVSLGTAMDNKGREIVLIEERSLTMPTGETSVDIFIAYNEVLSDPSTDPGITGFTRIEEIPNMIIVPPGTVPGEAVLLARVPLNSVDGQISGPIDNSVRAVAGGAAIGDETITEPKLADNAVSTRTLANGAVTEFKLGDDAVSANKLRNADNDASDLRRAVTTDHIRNRNVTESKLADDAVSTRTIQDDAVISKKIVDNAVTMNKLAAPIQSAIEGALQKTGGTLTGNLKVIDDGKVGIGTQSPNTKLHIVGGNDAALVGDAGFLVIGDLDDLNLVLDNNEILARDKIKQTANLHLQSNGGGVFVHSKKGNTFVVHDNGKVGIGTTDPQALLHVNGNAVKPEGGPWGGLSDKRLKKNVKPLQGALDDLLKLRGLTYEFREAEKYGNLTGPQIGFIAQEVEEVFPGWVSESSDGYKILTIRGFEALAVEALKQLHAENEKLKEKVNGLESRMKALEKKAESRREK